MVTLLPRAHAQDAETEKAIEKYRAMLREDPWSNPGYLDADRGEALFYRRSGPFDFACATCHSQSGLRIRLQGLPYLAEKKEASKVIGEWPAYRVSNTHVMTMQHRLLDCYWQMRMPELQMGSDASVALISFLTKQAEGGEIAVPGLKR